MIGRLPAVAAVAAAGALGGCAEVSTGSYSADRIALTAAGGAMKTHLTGGDPKIAAALAVIDGLVLLAKQARAGSRRDAVATSAGTSETAVRDATGGGR